MSWRDQLHLTLSAALGRHHEDPLVQQLAGLRRVGAAVYSLKDELAAKAEGPTRQRADTYYAAAEALVTMADAFVLDAFADPAHPKHLPQVTFAQATEWYRKIPALVSSVRRELAYPGAGDEPLPALLGPRLEAQGRCPVEHLLAMQRAAAAAEDLLGTRIELRDRQGEHEKIRSAVLLMTDARSQRENGDQVIGALQRGERVPDQVHEDAEQFFYDGVLRRYLYAAQELETAGITKNAPDSETEEDETEESPRVIRFPGAGGSGRMGGFGGFGGGFGGGFNWGTLLTVDVIANLAAQLMDGMFSGGSRW